MNKGRLEAFSDGVLAIIITIMVLEMKVPHSDGHAPTFEDLKPVFPVFLSYVLSFIYVGIYWNNHHHLIKAASGVSAGMMWANLHLLFWLSLVPFASGWMGENAFAAVPSAVYGLVMLMAAIAYYILQTVILAGYDRNSPIAASFGSDLKGKLSPLGYIAAIPLSFVNQWIAATIYALVALLWLIPDRRIERVIAKPADQKD
jgi:uncharacterized membrane protein